MGLFRNCASWPAAIRALSSGRIWRQILTADQDLYLRCLSRLPWLGTGGHDAPGRCRDVSFHVALSAYDALAQSVNRCLHGSVLHNHAELRMTLAFNFQHCRGYC